MGRHRAAGHRRARGVEDQQHRVVAEPKCGAVLHPARRSGVGAGRRDRTPSCGPRRTRTRPSRRRAARADRSSADHTPRGDARGVARGGTAASRDRGHMIGDGMTDTPTNRDERWVGAIYELAADATAVRVRGRADRRRVDRGPSARARMRDRGRAGARARRLLVADRPGQRGRGRGGGRRAARRPPAAPGSALRSPRGLPPPALWDDLGQGRRWMRRLLPRRPTYNVVAQAGDPDAERTIVVVAHHDAAHSGLVFHPALGQIGPRSPRSITNGPRRPRRSCSRSGSGR